MRRSSQFIVSITLALGLCASACEAERPPAPPKPETAPQATRSPTPTFSPSTAKAVYTYAADRGSFADTQDVAQVPENARGLVRVNWLEGPTPAAGMVWVANLRKVNADGTCQLQAVRRDAFEELALGEGLSSEVALPEGLELPEVAAHGDIIVYKTDWCGVCKKLMEYLDRKGVKYVAKDIEADREAAAELQAKVRARGLKAGSVPVIDVSGEVIVGFDRRRLEQLLAARSQPQAPARQ